MKNKLYDLIECKFGKKFVQNMKTSYPEIIDDITDKFQIEFDELVHQTTKQAMREARKLRQYNKYKYYKR